MKFAVKLNGVSIASTAKDTGRFNILSSIRHDVWHGASKPEAYEWWYFDAVSVDGRDLLVVIFLSNFIFSPRYNRLSSKARHKVSTQPPSAAPALAFTWYRDGRPVIRSITEYPASDFTASTQSPSCGIGSSGFNFEQRAGGGSYRLEINSPLRARGKLEASFDWRVMQGDLRDSVTASSLDTFATIGTSSECDAHEWNMVAPRCAVTGTMTITNRRGSRRTHEFIGTGYHDHNRDTRYLPETIAEWQWGRAHFQNATAVFYRFRELNSAPVTRLLLVRNDKLEILTASCRATESRLHHFGLRYPRQLRFTANDANSQGQSVTLTADQSRIVDGSFFYLRYTGQARLDTGDAQPPQEAILVSEHLAPRALRWRWLDWLTDMRINRNGRPSFLP